MITAWFTILFTALSTTLSTTPVPGPSTPGHAMLIALSHQDLGELRAARIRSHESEKSGAAFI